MKGFTLIELLAVLVILAIILLIAFPLISNLILGVKRDAFESSVKLIIKAVEQDYLGRDLNGDKREVEYKFEDGNQTVTPADVTPIDVNGSLPKDGIISVGSDGSIDAKVSDGNFYIDTDPSGNLNEPVAYDPGTHDPLLTGATPWVFTVTVPANGTFRFTGRNVANFTVNWGDGNNDTYNSVPHLFMQHQYTDAGTYTVSITGTAEHVSFCNKNDIITSGNCGMVTPTTPAYLTDILTPIPASMGLTDAYGMFAFTTKAGFTAVNFFDEASSNVTDMTAMFYNATNFNQLLNNWDTSKVTSMSKMFQRARAYNQSILTFDTSKVTDMSYMFDNADVYNQPLVGLDTSSVTNMSYMFNNAKKFNQPLVGLNTSNVTNFNGFLSRASEFNQELDGLNTSNALSMNSMFYYATVFNQPIGNWDTSKVTTMTNMFESATAFNQPLTNWNTSNVTNMSYMFRLATSFNSDLSGLDMGNVTNTEAMLSSATSFNQPIGMWDTSKITWMYAMFQNATSFNQNISTWNTSNVTEMRYMFYNATSFNRALNNWCVNKIASEPTYFSYNATAWLLAKPIWGTCP